MADISYTPDFHHTDWVDNVDRVQAGGPNGFNVRFHTIESDLQGVSTVVDEVNTALTQLGTTPPPQQQRLTLVPHFFTSDPSGTAWFLDDFGVARAVHGTGANSHGVMPLTLPDGVRLISMRAIGRTTAAPGSATATFITLRRSPIDANSQPVQLASVRGDTDPFDLTSVVDPTTARVDTGRFRYTITALAQSITDTSIMWVTSIELQLIAD